MVQRKKLSGKKIGVVFGTFAPFHIGHLSVAMKAKKENDGAVVIVSGRDGDRGDEVGLNLQRRFRYIRELFNDDEKVNVGKLDEIGMPKYPDGWQPWLKELDNIVDSLIETPIDEVDITIYCGEKEYKTKINQLRPDYNVSLEDRSIISISGTQIRENPLKYFKYITHPFQKHFTKKILVVGSASTGKTTLVKDLGKFFNAPVSVEYAREYEDKYNVTDDELDTKDYVRLFTGQYDQTSSAIDSKENNGLVIADTNSTVTMAYIDFYLKGKIPVHDYCMLHNLYMNTLEKEQWDLILVTQPKTEYVDDGFRDMSMDTEDIRWSFHESIIKLFEDAGFGDKVKVLKATDNIFYDNYIQAIDCIKKETGVEI